MTDPIARNVDRYTRNINNEARAAASMFIWSNGRDAIPWHLCYALRPGDATEYKMIITRPTWRSVTERPTLSPRVWFTLVNIVRDPATAELPAWLIEGRDILSRDYLLDELFRDSTKRYLYTAEVLARFLSTLFTEVNQ